MYLDDSPEYSQYGDSHNLLGIIYDLCGNKVAAINHYIKSLSEAKFHNDINQQAIIYNNIGSVFISVKDYRNAEKYLKIALELNKSLEYSNLISYSYICINLCKCYYGLSEFYSFNDIFKP